MHKVRSSSCEKLRELIDASENDILSERIQSNAYPFIQTCSQQLDESQSYLFGLLWPQKTRFTTQTLPYNLRPIKVNVPKSSIHYGNITSYTKTAVKVVEIFLILKQLWERLVSSWRPRIHCEHRALY